jgi:hypothetical protein
LQFSKNGAFLSFSPELLSSMLNKGVGYAVNNKEERLEVSLLAARVIDRLAQSMKLISVG